MTLRFWIRRGGAESERTTANLLATRRRNALCSRTARSIARMSDADDTPRSSNPWGDANVVSAIPRARARAFIASTNAPTLPDSSMASASAASFADPRSRPASSPRTETRSPGLRPSVDPAP